jgi:hypothetical protein
MEQLASAIARSVRSDRDLPDRLLTCTVSLVERASTRTLARA